MSVPMTQPESGTCTGNSKSDTPIIIGGNLKAAGKRAWLYVGRTSRDTTTDILKHYLAEKLNTIEVLVEELPHNNNQERTSRSFKVGIDFNKLNTVESDDFWPQNIVIRRFRFFRGQKQTTQSQSGAV